MNTPTMPIEPAPRTWPRIAFAALTGGLVAGTVDVGAAALISRNDPRFILRFIAGGVQGRQALQGGVEVAWLGLLLQWGMSILIAAIFVIAATRLRWLVARWLEAGLAYGVIVFAVMNYVVMPLSAWHRVNHFTLAGFAWNLAAMLLFGLIVAFVTRSVLRKP